MPSPPPVPPGAIRSPPPSPWWPPLPEVPPLTQEAPAFVTLSNRLQTVLATAATVSKAQSRASALTADGDADASYSYDDALGADGVDDASANALLSIGGVLSVGLAGFFAARLYRRRQHASRGGYARAATTTPLEDGGRATGKLGKRSGKRGSATSEMRALAYKMEEEEEEEEEADDEEADNDPGVVSFSPTSADRKKLAAAGMLGGGEEADEEMADVGYLQKEEHANGGDGLTASQRGKREEIQLFVQQASLTTQTAPSYSSLRLPAHHAGETASALVVRALDQAMLTLPLAERGDATYVDRMPVRVFVSGVLVSPEAWETVLATEVSRVSIDRPPARPPPSAASTAREAEMAAAAAALTTRYEEAHCAVDPKALSTKAAAEAMAVALFTAPTEMPAAPASRHLVWDYDE